MMDIQNNPQLESHAVDLIMPAEELVILEELETSLSYNETAQQLEFTGLMTSAEYLNLSGICEEKCFQEALLKLYHSACGQTLSVPLEKHSIDPDELSTIIVIPHEWDHRLTYDADVKSLTLYGFLEDNEFQEARKFCDHPIYLIAITDLFTQSLANRIDPVIPDSSDHLNNTQEDELEQRNNYVLRKIIGTLFSQSWKSHNRGTIFIVAFRWIILLLFALTFEKLADGVAIRVTGGEHFTGNSLFAGIPIGILLGSDTPTHEVSWNYLLGTLQLIVTILLIIRYYLCLVHKIWASVFPDVDKINFNNPSWRDSLINVPMKTIIGTAIVAFSELYLFYHAALSVPNTYQWLNFLLMVVIIDSIYFLIIDNKTRFNKIYLAPNLLDMLSLILSIILIGYTGIVGGEIITITTLAIITIIISVWNFRKNNSIYNAHISVLLRA